MPNWVSNSLFLNGSEERVKELLAFVKTEYSDFDFHAITPMPTDLKNTRCPMQIISQAEYDEQEKRIAEGKLTDDEKKWGVSRCLTQELYDKYIAEYGACDWYGFNTNNWGTKWNASEVYIDGNSVHFNTAWSMPYPIYNKLSLMFPDVEIEVEFMDEDFGHNLGKFSLLNGEEVYAEIPEGGSEEAYIMAFDIGGQSDYYTWDMFFDINDDSELDKFELSMIKIAYTNDKLVDEEFPKVVLDEFLRLALEDEEFEFASKIRDIMKSKEKA